MLESRILNAQDALATTRPFKVDLELGQSHGGGSRATLSTPLESGARGNSPSVCDGSFRSGGCRKTFLGF